MVSVAARPIPYTRRISVSQDVIDTILETLGPSALGIYVYLSRRANRDGEAWPSYDTIARDCGVQRRWAMKVVATLVDGGWIEVIPQQDRRGGHAANRYRLPHQIALFTPSEPPSEPPGEQPGGLASVVPIRQVKNEEEKKNGEKERGVVPAGFSAFWSAYPHCRQRSVKSEALKVWQAKALEPITDRILEVLERCEANPDWTKQGGEFVPGAQRWLRTEPWLEDEAQPQAPAAQQRGTVVIDRRGEAAPFPSDWEPDPATTSRGSRFAEVPESFVLNTIVPQFRTWASSRTSRDWQATYLNFVRGRSWEGDPS